MTDLSVIVVAYHSADLLHRCLFSLPRDLSVWVVDNSSDAEVKAAADKSGAEYVDTGSNLGFAAGVNAGLRLIPPDHDVLLLNPDAVLTEGALKALHAFLRRPGNERLAAVSPALLDPHDGSSQRVRWPLPTPGRMWREAFGFNRLVPPPDEYSIGAVLLLRREAIDDVGPFDERFFLYAEEADWQRRAIDRGWLTAEFAAVQAVHVGAGTSPKASRREALFHAGQETYVRKWFGHTGWLSYRVAAVLAAGARGLLLREPAATTAIRRASLYIRGPRRTAGLGRREACAGLRITHVVVTDAFAGVERYVAEVASEQAAGGADVTVIGGDPARMLAELGRAHHLPARKLGDAVRQLARLGRQDIVHAHMTAAEFAAVAATPFHRAPIVSTRHFAGPRGSSALARRAGRLIRPRIVRQISISEYVATSIGEPSVVIHNGVRSQPDGAASRANVVLCLQRLEREKATDLALRAWAASSLANEGWELHLAGSGALRGDLECLAQQLGITSTVRWLGQVTDTQEHLGAAGLLFATATAEPFGLSVAEAMALGTPVLASDGGAHPELLGPDGWTFAAGNDHAASEALRRAVTRPEEERSAYGLSLQQRQRTLFDLGKHVAALDRQYHSLDGSPVGLPPLRWTRRVG